MEKRQDARPATKSLKLNDTGRQTVKTEPRREPGRYWYRTWELMGDEENVERDEMGSKGVSVDPFHTTRLSPGLRSTKKFFHFLPFRSLL